MATDTLLDGYVYTGDVSPADYGGRWLGVSADTLGHVIEVIGAADLAQPAWEPDGSDNDYCIVQSGDIYVHGHNEIRRALDSCGWHIRGIADRTQRRAMMLDAYVSYYGYDVAEDFDGRYQQRMSADDESAVLAQVNRWAR